MPNPVEPFYSIFCAYFERWSNGIPYRPRAGDRRDGDFVQFADLLKTIRNSPKPEWLTEARFERAVRNYFASTVATPTLADLSVRFATFYKSSLNEYNKPVTPRSTVGVQAGEAIPGAAPTFEFCSRDCRDLFDAGKFACDDCEQRLRNFLGY